MISTFHFVLICHVEDEEQKGEPQLIRGRLQDVTPAHSAKGPDQSVLAFEGVDAVPALVLRQIRKHREG